MWDFEKSHNYQKSSVSFDFLLLDVILVIISPSLCQCSLYSCLVTDAPERYWGYTPQRLLRVFVKPTSWSATSEYLLGFYLQPCNWVPKDRFQESFFMFHVRKMRRGSHSARVWQHHFPSYIQTDLSLPPCAHWFPHHSITLKLQFMIAYD